MKKVLLICIGVSLLFACKKNSNSVVSTQTTAMMKMIIHHSGTSSYVDTAYYNFDTQNRLISLIKASFDTAFPNNINAHEGSTQIFTYSGSSAQPSSYTYMDSYGDNDVSILSFDDGGDLVTDSIYYLGVGGYTYLSRLVYTGNTVYDEIFQAPTNGNDTLEFDNNHNLLSDHNNTDEATQTVYGSYISGLNPLYAIHDLAPIYFNRLVLMVLDRSLLYSKNLPSSEIMGNGTATTQNNTFQYGFSNGLLTHITESVNGIGVTNTYQDKLDFFY